MSGRLGRKLQETGERCPDCDRRDCVAVFEFGSDTILACGEVCEWREPTNPAPKGGSPRG